MPTTAATLGGPGVADRRPTMPAATATIRAMAWELDFALPAGHTAAVAGAAAAARSAMAT